MDRIFDIDQFARRIMGWSDDGMGEPAQVVEAELWYCQVCGSQRGWLEYWDASPAHNLERLEVGKCHCTEAALVFLHWRITDSLEEDSGLEGDRSDYGLRCQICVKGPSHLWTIVALAAPGSIIQCGIPANPLGITLLSDHTKDYPRKWTWTY